MSETQSVHNLERSVGDPPSRTGWSLQGRGTYLAVFVVAVVFFLYCWSVQPGRPPLQDLTDDATAGWYGGSADQINYAREARALSQLELPGIYWDYDAWEPRPDRPADAEVTDYAYGLGYPVLGVPFIWLGLKGDPFVIPNSLMFGAAACLVFAIARRFLTDRGALLTTAAIVFATPFVNFIATPWNTTITVIAALTIIYVGVSSDRSWPATIAVAASVSLAFAARYVDVVWLGLLAAAAIGPRLRHFTRIVVVGAATLAVTSVLVLWSHQQVFGSAFTTPLHYHFHDGKRGDDLSDYKLSRVPEHSIAVFITSQQTNGDRSPTGHDPLLRDYFWLLAAPSGVYVLAKRERRLRALVNTVGFVLLAAAAVSIVASVFYLSYWSSGGDDIKNGNGRFFVAWFPVWGVLAAIGIADVYARLTGRHSVATSTEST